MKRRIVIQRAEHVHAESISALICDAIRRVNAQHYAVTEIDRLLKNFSVPCVRAFLTERLTLVALFDSVVVGTGALQQSELKSVFVSPDLHRMGIGRELVAALEGAASEQGVKCLSVSSSLSAVEFYASLGYIEQSREFFGKEETVRMVKPNDAAGRGKNL